MAEEMPPNGSLTSAETIHLLNLFTSLLHQTEVRILEGMRHATGQLADDLASNAASEGKRWAHHEQEHEAHEREVLRRWEEGMNALRQLEAEAHRRWKLDDEEEFRYDARVQPLRALLSAIWRYRKDIIIVLLGAFALFGLSAEWLLFFK